ncbi:helix-turn-helix domain-containing protein [uncultured Oscillibacter sp.]|uniref:helix-turn-helix domain-containing protein n=1 Tax=uncultured Oscillibacter sp. TaxID=876091 RepID=UPI0025D4D8DB|nr:helix-turn-helix transcriptional regulator [uncultured Oscillibacter sp.]
MLFPRIRDLREDRDWTQAHVANLLGVRQTTYSKYELGKILVPIDMLIKLADLYHVSLDYLAGRSDRP